MKLQLPLPSAVTCPIGLPLPSVRVTVAPGSAVPLISAPLLGLTTGAAGATESTVVLAGALVLPVGSLAVALTTVPLASGVPGVKLQLPLPSAVTWPIGLPSFYPAVLEFEGMDVVVLAIALRIPRDQRLAAPVALDPEVVRILGLEDPHVVPLPVGEAALEPLGEPPEALMAPENQGFTAFRGPVAGAAVLDEQAVPL